MTRYVFYHDNCVDGFGAALCARTYLERQKYKVNYEAVTYENVKDKTSFLTTVRYTDVYFLDFCPSKEVLETLLGFHNVYVIDHHATAEPILKELSAIYKNLMVSFSYHKSGTALAWEHFFPRNPKPKLIQYISDRDLWTFELGQNTEICHLALTTIRRDFKTWEPLLADGNLDRALQRYSVIYDYSQNQILQIASSAKRLRWQGYDAAVVYCPPMFASHVGNLLLERFDIEIALVVSLEYPLKAKVSLRSDGKPDVSQIAKKFGGGGHRAAAGFVTDGLEFLGVERGQSQLNGTKRVSKREEISEDGD